MMKWFDHLPPRVRDVFILAPIPFAFFLISKPTAWILFTVISFIGLHEWRRIVCQNRERFYTLETRIAMLCQIGAMILVTLRFELAILFVLASSCWIYLRAPMRLKTDLALGQLIIGMVGVLAYDLRIYSGHKTDEQLGLALFGLVLILTVFSDSAAYFVGRQFGKHKLAPVISPNKTWEGAIGGWIFGVLAALIYCHFFVRPLGHLNMIIQILLFWGLVISAQLGDIGESWLKRKYGVKDSGVTLRSHGGMLDRFDSFGPVLVLLCLGLWVLV